MTKNEATILKLAAEARKEFALEALGLFGECWRDGVDYNVVYFRDWLRAVAEGKDGV